MYKIVADPNAKDAEIQHDDYVMIIENKDMFQELLEKIEWNVDGKEIWSYDFRYNKLLFKDRSSLEIKIYTGRLNKFEGFYYIYTFQDSDEKMKEYIESLRNKAEFYKEDNVYILH
jgi:hypothetical protein